MLMISKFTTRKLISILLAAAVIPLALAMLLAGPTAAQTPNPAKGPNPTPATQPTPAPPAINRSLLPKIEPGLLKSLLQAGGRPVPFIVYLKAKTNLAAAPGAQATDPVARRAAVVNALQQTARNTQAGVIQTLLNPPGGVGGQNAAANIRPLWIINAVAASGSLETVLALAARPDVEVIRPDRQIRLNPAAPPADQAATAGNRPRSAVEWGVGKIRADLVHNALNITGAGVVVANVDSGVDWQHPALQTKYRGYTGPGKLPQHTGNWYDATGDGAAYPVDGNGHGTHTMGTMVGDGGLGVAPGARWIAVRAFNSSGVAQNSWLHLAFQWILAPNGNPALAPNIVNNSWGSDFGASTEFEADVQALRAANIFPVFSAGNNGPGSGTVGSPGSLADAFTVGATTSSDDIALFSSRGPSPWGQIKPNVSAPGKDVRSSVPGGAYATFDGTSMAAPHASGLAALLLQASPALSTNLNAIANAMESTAVQLGSPIPNNNFGWGRIDAYNAVMSVAAAGTLQGSVTVSGSGQAINGATVRITPHGGGPDINTTTNASGAYVQGLAANTYDATASAFGYAPDSVFGLSVTTGTATIQNFSLTPIPTGTLSGTVREAGTGAPLVAAITIEDTPTGTTSGANGSYSLTLPAGTYTATVVAARHRITRAVNITINDGATVVQDFWLNPAPAILLVDSGAWYQESEIGYYQQALTDLLYPYDTWQITKPFDTPGDVPTAATLLGYDIVIWSAPFDSPGYIGADAALESYLDGGGKLLLSGQDVAYFDGGGFIGSAPYLKNYLKTTYVQDDSGANAVTGAGGEPFDGLSLSLSGGDGADNQYSPDVIAVADSDFGRPLLYYTGNTLAGLHVGLCVPYRAMFLSFGFEGINSAADRRTVMEQALNWLMQSPAATGVELTPASETGIGSFGAVVSHTVRVRNTGAAANTYTLAYTSTWPVNPAPPATVSLGSCLSQEVTFGVTVNTTAWHTADVLTLTARSAIAPVVTGTVTRTTKSPAPVLLVDDDRWYSFAGEYKTALEANNIPYDYWQVPKSWIGPAPSSPSQATLQMYPMTIWYTAYDWFQPLTADEETRLAGYLDGGGRLLFSSQDYIYNLPNHQPDDFAKNYLGILAHTEDFSSTLVTGENGNPVGNYLGPYTLTFPPGYANWTDALTPTTAAQVASRGQANQPNGLTLSGPGSGNRYWHTNFLAFGPELLSAGERARLIQRSLGWLSWLGRSTVTPSTAAALDGATVTFTAAITYDGWDAVSSTAYFTAVRPANLTWNSYSPELVPAGNDLTWNGTLNQNQSKVFTYTATIAGSLPLGTVISQTSWLAYPEHNILFDRIATVKVNFPDLSQSAMSVTPAQNVEAGDTLTYTIILKNSGLVDAPAVTTTNSLPHMLSLAAVNPPAQGTVTTGQNGFTWTTALAKDQAATLTFRAVVSYQTSTGINNTAYASDGLNEPVDMPAQATFKSIPTYLPLIIKN